MNRKLIMALLGAILMMVGVFLPALHIPMAETGVATLMQIPIPFMYGTQTGGFGFFFLIAGIASVAFALFKKYQGLWWAGLLSIVLLVYLFGAYGYLVANQSEIDIFRTFGGSEQLLLGWGLVVVLIGAIFIVVSAAMKE